jgi:threonine/homoserine/homoserine lactone efflux protein
MDILLLVKGAIVGFLASIPLGPVGVLCIQRTINKGKTSGLYSGLGAAVVDMLYAVVAVLGLSFIIKFIEEQAIYFQFMGGIVLFILGIRIFYTNPVHQIRKHRRKKSNLIEDFFSVVVLTLSNPLAVFLFIAAFAGMGIVTANKTWFDSGLLIVGVFLGATFWWFLLTRTVNAFRKKFRLKQLWWVNKIAGAVIVLFGFFTVLSIFWTS